MRWLVCKFPENPLSMRRDQIGICTKSGNVARLERSESMTARTQPPRRRTSFERALHAARDGVDAIRAKIFGRSHRDLRAERMAEVRPHLSLSPEERKKLLDWHVSQPETDEALSEGDAAYQRYKETLNDVDLHSGRQKPTGTTDS